MQLIDPAKLSIDEWNEYLILDPDSVDWHADPAAFVRTFTKFFKTSGQLADKFSDEDLNSAFWSLLGESGLFCVLADGTLSLDDRLECIESMHHVFADLFSVRCSPKLSAGLREVDPEMSPLNSVCYMWWDIYPSWGSPSEPVLRALDEAIMLLQERCLQIEHEAVQESALHGLGHWHLNYPSESEKIIDGFLKMHSGISPQLAEYAKAARTGCVN
jgi:hypothetical protein